MDSLLSAMRLSEESLEFEWTLLAKHRIKTGIIVLLVKTKQTQTVGPILPQTALMAIHIEVMVMSLETDQYWYEYQDGYWDGPCRDAKTRIAKVAR
ncbi:hypothetical protein A6R68_20547 [Neotoma lepida]|uniref:Uncharacterized protein n=1 Tax=Neotoma lepida TaxID=56216 RepID=A0A1A6HU39_NEOLE|nr:hypothetical protein A6R68_20547 [Neotoma lepida]